MTEHPSSPPPDPTGIEEPHDILAAEEFGIGTRDDRFPPDPQGITEPHDVLAAEEFPMPAGVEPHGDPGVPGPRAWIPLAGIIAGLVALVVLRRRRSS